MTLRSVSKDADCCPKARTSSCANIDFGGHRYHEPDYLILTRFDAKVSVL